MLTVHGHSLIPASTVVIRRSALEAIGGFQYVPNQCFVDFPTFVELSFRGKFFLLPGSYGAPPNAFCIRYSAVRQDDGQDVAGASPCY